jgi:tetratricopeptide (TPR) repeat protein
MYSRFNLAIAYYHLGEYKKTVEEYEKVESQLPFRMLWYQIEPIDAYFRLGNYDKVFELTNAILNNQNRAYSELYLLRGKIYEKQGNKEAAKAEYENAVYYNTNLKAAIEALKT